MIDPRLIGVIAGHRRTTNDALLYLKFDGLDATTTITDSSPYADHTTANTGQEIDTAESKFGGSSLHITQQEPFGLYYEDSRFAKPNTTDELTIQFWFKYTTAASFTAAPPLFYLDAADNFRLLRCAKYSTGDRIAVQIGGNPSVVHTFTPEADGWNFVRFTCDSTGTLSVYVNTDFVTSNSLGNWSTLGKLYVGGSEAGTGLTPISCWMDDFVVTPHYLGAVTSLPTSPFA